MGIHYKLRLKDLKIEYLRKYFLPILKYFKPTKKISNYQDVKEFIQKKSCVGDSRNTLWIFKNKNGSKICPYV